MKLSQYAKQQAGRRGEFGGTVAQFSSKRVFGGPDLPTKMLRNVKEETGQMITDHRLRDPAYVRQVEMR